MKYLGSLDQKDAELIELERDSEDIEMMPNIAYIMETGNMSYFEVMKLPYVVFLSVLKQFRLMELQETEEGREMLRQSELLSQTEPDLDSIRNLNNYKSVEVE